ncbi:MAG: hypothetical protein ACK5UI_02565 [Bacteroidota bacterium]|jgi:hypothetical protein
MNAAPEENPKQVFSDAYEHLQEYLETEKEIIRLQVVKHSSKTIGYMVAIFALFMLGFVFYLLMNVSVAIWLAQYFDSYFYGFLYVALANGFILLLFAIFKDSLIVRPVQNLLIRLITEKNGEEFN